MIASMITDFSKTPNIEYLKKIKNIFFVGGLYDLTDITKTFLNAYLGLTDDRIAALSPLTYDFSDWLKLDIQIFVYAMEIDSPTFIRQSEELYSILKNRYNLNCYFKKFIGFDHLDIMEKFIDPNEEFTTDVLKTIK